MRKTIRPVTLRRIIELTALCEQETQATADEIQETLALSDNRTEEVLAEMERLSLLNRDPIRLTPTGEAFAEAIASEDWHSVHDTLYEQSPHYGAFIDLLEDHASPQGLTDTELVEKLNQRAAELRFNATGVTLLTDWGERLRAIQRNVFEDRYYSIISERDAEPFEQTLQEAYEALEVTRGVNLRQRYISIPRLREHICERLRISRETFDERLAAVCRTNVGKLELSGAPLNTQAKESRRGIKTIEKDPSGEVVTTEMSSDQVLSGVRLADRKMYYYLTIFDQLTAGDTQ